MLERIGRGELETTWNSKEISSHICLSGEGRKRKKIVAREKEKGVSNWSMYPGFKFLVADQ